MTVPFRQLEPLAETEQLALRRLRSMIHAFGRVCIAYSGGVDSALVATIAQEQLGAAATALSLIHISEPTRPY